MAIMRCTFAALFCLMAKTTILAGSTTAIGWVGTGGDMTGAQRQITDIWTGRSTWNDVSQVGWPSANADFMAFAAANPQASVNFATALIPHDQPSTNWNTLLDAVSTGTEDNVFVQQGQIMAKYGTQTVYCRPWWEMTMSTTNLDPVRFIAAWNHAVPLIRAAFVKAAPTKTLKIVFCYLPNTSAKATTFYPGDANVDVIDADIYAAVWSSTTPSLTALLAQVNSNLSALAALATAHSKPIGISEWGNFAVQAQGTATNQGRGDVPQYIDAMFNFAAKNQVLYMVYFNLSTGGILQTFADTPLSLAEFKADEIALHTPVATTAVTPVVTPVDPPEVSTFTAWQAKNFSSSQLADPSISGPTADPYGIGIQNLLAYALQLDPLTAQPTSIPMATPVAGHLTMTYFVPSALTDVSFIPEVSTDLRTWSSGTIVVKVTATVPATNGTLVTVADSLPSSFSKRFMRLRVTQTQ